MISLLTEGADFEHSDHGPDRKGPRFVEVLPEVGARDDPRHDAEWKRRDRWSETQSRQGWYGQVKLTLDHIRTGLRGNISVGSHVRPSVVAGSQRGSRRLTRKTPRLAKTDMAYSRGWPTRRLGRGGMLHLQGAGEKSRKSEWWRSHLKKGVRGWAASARRVGERWLLAGGLSDCRVSVALCSTTCLPSEVTPRAGRPPRRHPCLPPCLLLSPCPHARLGPVARHHLRQLL